MKSRRRIVIALGLTLFFLCIGTIGYVEIEGYSILEAFYMTVITISTVGFGEIVPLTDTGRVFTIFLILSGVGSIALAAHAFTESMIERASNPMLRQRAMQRKIRNLQGHFIICGYGRVGASAADYFHKTGKGFVVLEKSKEHLQLLTEQGYFFVVGDATHEETLLEAGIKGASGLLALLDSDPENLFTVLTAREMNPTLNIIARTEVASSESRILRAGADSVISPYASAGRRVAGRIIKDVERENREGFQEGSAESKLKWLPVSEEMGLASHAILSANTIVKGTILGIRRDGKDLLQPSPDFQIELGDELLVASLRAVVPDKQKQNQPKKIVLVDDNPVIRRLYTRLFQKAGFNIITAETAAEGYETIIDEEPDAAVIDYHLPDMTGLEICRQIREDENGLLKIKLFLFTADDQEETKQKALAAGVDTVVVKSPDSGEIISIVKEGLND